LLLAALSGCTFQLQSNSEAETLRVANAAVCQNPWGVHDCVLQLPMILSMPSSQWLQANHVAKHAAKHAGHR
jgi:hypothetical protein